MRRKQRIMFYVHDRIGIGHLRKISKLAGSLADEFACAIVCGHRNIDWLIPSRCEYFQIPSLARLVPTQADVHGETLWLSLSSDEARDFRRSLIMSIASVFEPNAVVVEHFPLGLNNELDGVLDILPCIKIFSTSGLLTVHDRSKSNIFNARGTAAIAQFYSKVLVTADPKIIDIRDLYNLPDAVVATVEPVGYMSQSLTRDTVSRVRSERGLVDGNKWVVCSAGSGALGEKLIQECERQSRIHRDVFFDIIVGPMSSLFPKIRRQDVREGGRVIVHGYAEALGQMHGSADVVVCSGGTNSLIEAMEGGAQILSCPVQVQFDDEQFVHARRLASYYPLELVAQTSDLGRVLSKVLARSDAEPRPSVRNENRLMFDGIPRAAAIIRNLVSHDQGTIKP